MSTRASQSFTSGYIELECGGKDRGWIALQKEGSGSGVAERGWPHKLEPAAETNAPHLRIRPCLYIWRVTKSEGGGGPVHLHLGGRGLKACS